MKRRPYYLLFLFVSLFFGCAPAIRNYSSKISNDALANHGIITGRMSLYDQRTKAALGGLFGKSFTAYMHRLGKRWPSTVNVTNNNDGFFAWIVEPGTYWIHYCRIKDPYEEVTLRDFSPQIEVRKGEVVYIGHIHYEIGKTHFKETMKQTFKKIGRQSLKEALFEPSGLLIDVGQAVTDKREEIQRRFPNLASDPRLLSSVQLIESWSSKVE